MRLGTHVIDFPNGRWGFVGSLPPCLGQEARATKADVLGCRAYRNAEGELVVCKFPLFDTKEQALQYAQSKGVTISANLKV